MAYSKQLHKTLRERTQPTLAIVIKLAADKSSLTVRYCKYSYMKNPNQDSEQIWQAYTAPDSQPQVIGESSMGRLFEQASAIAKRLARVNNIPLNHSLFEYAVQVYQAGFEAGCSVTSEQDEFGDRDEMGMR